MCGCSPEHSLLSPPQDYALDEKAFAELVKDSGCPQTFIDTAFQCCKVSALRMY